MSEVLAEALANYVSTNLSEREFFLSLKLLNAENEAKELQARVNELQESLENLQAENDQLQSKYTDKQFQAVESKMRLALEVNKRQKAEISVKTLEAEIQRMNLENSKKSIDAPGGKESDVYKYRGTFTLPNGQTKEITGKTANDFLQKASDATAAWFEENGASPSLPAAEAEKAGPTFREWTETLIQKKVLKAFERHQDMGYLENWIYPFFGDKLITNIKHTDCQEFADHLSKTASKTGKSLGYASAKKIIDLLKSILERAVRDDILTKNPVCGIANRCKQGESKFRNLADAEKIIFLKAVSKMKETSVQLFAAICIATGLRPEEVAALTWSDYHTEEEIPYFTINKAVQTQNLPKGQKGAAIKETKTKAGKRRVPVMCPQVVALLNEARQTDGYIIRGLKKNCDGKKPISGHQKAAIDDKMNEYLLAEGMKLRTTGYDCRHTMATMLDSTGAAQKSSKYIMGHASNDFTLETYVENDWAQAKKDAQKVSDYFSKLSVA